MHSRLLLKTIRSSDQSQTKYGSIQLDFPSNKLFSDYLPIQSTSHTLAAKEEEVVASKLYLIEAANNPGTEIQHLAEILKVYLMALSGVIEIGYGPYSNIQYGLT